MLGKCGVGLGLVTVACGVYVYAQSAQTRPAPLEYTFHHVHVRVPDPGAAINEASSRTGGTRTLLQGHGPSVRTSGQFLVFEREDQERVAAGDSRSYVPELHAASVYLQAAKWLSERDAVVQPPQFASTAIAKGMPPFRIDTIAFAATDLDAAVTAFDARGQKPFARTEDTARYRVHAELTLEIVRDTDALDAFWCPMHPDVRAPRPTTCPRCGMDLVPIPPPKTGEYRLDVELTPRADRHGISQLRLAVRDPETGEPVTTFTRVHERPFHLFVISRDLSQFAHVHPEQENAGAFTLTHDLPPGEYVLIADFLPAGGTPQMVHRAIVTPGYAGPLFSAPPDPAPSVTEQVVDGARIAVRTPALAALKRSRMEFTFADAATGAPLTDLEPYLGASAHLLVVTPDLTHAIHGHPEGTRTSGPTVVFEPLLPVSGAYKMWVQVQRRGRVTTVPFVVNVK